MDHRSNIMSNDMRTLPSFFSNTGKTEKFDPIKTFWSTTIPYLTFNYSCQTQLHYCVYIKSLMCIFFFHWKLYFSLKLWEVNLDVIF